MPLTLKLAAAPLCAFALIASGCGGTSGYKDDLKSANKEFTKAFKKANEKIRAAKSRQDLSTGFTESKSAIQTLEGKLRTLKPPTKARAAQAQLLRALDNTSQDLDTLLGSLRSNTLEKIPGSLTKFAQDLPALDVAGRRLEKQAG